MSILSFVEIIEIFFNFFFILIDYVQEKKKNRIIKEINASHHKNKEKIETKVEV
jgi:hypothetical protein